MFRGFINGLKKSFDGKDHLRELSICKCKCACDENAFADICMACENGDHVQE